MSSNPRVLAVIPARAGSKGIPGKNLRAVAGRTLIARAITSALAAETVDEVVVSTDGDAIAAEAVAAGATVVWRPAELSGDEASSESALLHALDMIAIPGPGTDENAAPEVLLFLQATSPFIDPADLDRAVTRVLEGSADSVLAAAPSHAFLWRVAEDGSAIAVNHDAATRPRRQDRAPEFRETGAFYAVRVAAFREARHRFVGRVELAVVPASTAIDIDEPHDLALASALAPLLEAQAAPADEPALAPAPPAGGSPAPHATGPSTSARSRASSPPAGGMPAPHTTGPSTSARSRASSASSASASASASAASSASSASASSASSASASSASAAPRPTDPHPARTSAAENGAP
jgi:CMP-N-acetylneuraminic acid synthetase